MIVVGLLCIGFSLAYAPICSNESSGLTVGGMRVAGC